LITEEEKVDEGMQKHSQSVKNGKNECIKRPVSASKTCSESATQVSPMTSYPYKLKCGQKQIHLTTMKFKTTKTDHKAHHFVVDKSLTFATCSVCAVTMKRKTVGWDTREDVLT